MTVTLQSHSARACSYATVMFSPDYSVVNSAGVSVRRSCWYSGGPAPWPYVLNDRVLARGAAYTDRLS